MSGKAVHVIGAGLAGAEAAWQIACRGVEVELYEMKPHKHTPAHKTNHFAELVCSNSLRSSQLSNAVGLLKEEMRRLDSLILRAADATAVPAGAALAVDRHAFSEYVTARLTEHPLIHVHHEERVDIDPDAITVIATGPLTSQRMSDYIAKMVGYDYLSFFDAAAPIVDAASIDTSIAYLASRYGKGEACYYNCPMNEKEYNAFYEALIRAECAKLHDFDRPDQELTVFEGCMPVEEMARRGRQTLCFGPLKPVGLPDPRTGRDPFAVVQLRAENREMTMFNLVGFQTHLTFGEQKRVFRMIPGLQNAEFLRYGVMHRNTFLDSPKLLTPTYAMRTRQVVFFAGQMTGVEGYVESASSGLVAGINAAQLAKGDPPVIFSTETAIGALAAYVSDPSVTKFQPMNANFGLISPFGRKVKGGKAARNEAIAARALSHFDPKKESDDENPS